MSFEKLVQKFNEDSSDEFLRAFGSPDDPIYEIFPKFLELMDKRGLFDKLKIGQFLDNHNYLTNSYFKFLFDSDKRRGELIKNLSVVHWRDIKNIDGKIYFYLDKKEDLSKFFCSRDGGRSGISSRELVSSAFSEDSWEMYSETTQDLFHDVIEVLSEENLKYLSKEITDTIKQINISQANKKIYDTHIPELAEAQGHKEYLVLTPEIVKDLLVVRPTFNILLLYLGDDFRNSLFSVHNQAYNEAIIDEQYEKIWSELEGFGIPKGKYVENDKYMTEITSLYENVIGNYVYEFNGYADDPGEYSSFTDLLERLQDYSDDYGCLHVRVTEYADYRLVKKYVNVFFRETVYI